MRFRSSSAVALRLQGDRRQRIDAVHDMFQNTAHGQFSWIGSHSDNAVFNRSMGFIGKFFAIERELRQYPPPS
jgi:hypothetical protein